MIERAIEAEVITDKLRHFPVVAVLGARQVGKTTLARQLRRADLDPITRFDLENPEDQARLSDPMLVLKNLEGTVVLDEVQRYPGLFPILRVLVDRPDNPLRFIVLGSASPELLKQSSESLAGRIYYHTLSGFSSQEVGVKNMELLWRRGGFPRSFLASSEAESFEWRRQFVRTFLERDIPQFGLTLDSVTLRRFWTMLAHYHGQVWNGSELSRSLGVADTTLKRYLNILEAAFVVKQLQPWRENLKKRQVKSPKVYINDAGILHVLLNIHSQEELESHPKAGASWEGFIIDELCRYLDPSEYFFWATHAGADLDLFINTGAARFGVEIKRTASPKKTRSMYSATEDLGLTKLFLIHAGDSSFPLSDKIQAVSSYSVRQDIVPVISRTAR